MRVKVVVEFTFLSMEMRYGLSPVVCCSANRAKGMIERVVCGSACSAGVCSVCCGMPLRCDVVFCARYIIRMLRNVRSHVGQLVSFRMFPLVSTDLVHEQTHLTPFFRIFFAPCNS